MNNHARYCTMTVTVPIFVMLPEVPTTEIVYVPGWIVGRCVSGFVEVEAPPVPHPTAVRERARSTLSNIQRARRAETIVNIPIALNPKVMNIQALLRAVLTVLTAARVRVTLAPLPGVTFAFEKVHRMFVGRFEQASATLES